MAQTIRTYKEETKCMNCGRNIKNVVEVDGVPYGVKCCEIFIESPIVARKIKSTDFDVLVAESAREELKSLRDSLLDYAMSVLPANPFTGGASTFFNQPTDRLEDQITRRPNSAVVLGVIAILEARKIVY